MSADTEKPQGSGPGVKQVLKDELSKVPGLLQLVRMTVETVRVCMQYRVTGLAAEAGYFALLSLPPLVFGLVGGVGYLGDFFGQDIVSTVTKDIQSYASGFLTESSLNEVLMPTIRKALSAGRPDVISIGFLLSFWSGSRCLNVLLDTISIMYSQGGKRGIVRTRILSLSLYVTCVIFGAIVLPLIVIGPEMLSGWLPVGFRFIMVFYWPLVGGLTILGFASLYYIATPHRTPWVRDLPGAALTLATWVVTSMVLRWALNRSIVGGLTIYGPLAVTIVVLIWLYFLSIGVLIGAALNAATVRLWPPPELLPVRERARALFEDGVSRLRERDAGAAADAEAADNPPDDGPAADRDTAEHGPSGEGTAVQRRRPKKRPRPPDDEGDGRAGGGPPHTADRSARGDARAGLPTRPGRKTSSSRPGAAAPGHDQGSLDSSRAIG